ncbi:MAG: ABC transporter ATP-binding protein [Verrucomicrobia bacterium]|nr:ABC transporter ATP-binding protein [Verrucomicrobiota bacterium]MBI3869254.1 ABC transporter ATP-binding protein [Verrucomicrobiota bacterium]
MGNLRDILRFGWPYLRRYRARFFAGILLGLVFSAVSGALVPAASLVMNRIDPPTSPRPAEAIAERYKTPFDSIRAPVEKWARESKEAAFEALDPWLPKARRPLDWKQAVGVLILLPLLMALRGFTGYFSSYCLGWVTERVINDMQVDVLKKLHSLSLDYFNKSQLGDLTARVQSDTAWLHRSLNLGLSDLVKEPSTVLFVFLCLLAMDPQMTLFVLVLLPACILPVIVLGKKIRRAADRSVTTKVSQSSLLYEILTGIRVVKAFNLEAYQADRFSDYARDLVRHGVKGVQAKELVNPIIETVTAFVFGVLLIFLFSSGREPKEMMPFIIGLVAVYTPFKKIAGLHVLFEQSSAGVRRLGQILQERPTVAEPAQASAIPAFSRSLRLKNVSFGYGDRTILHDVNLDIPAGQRVGIAGESGSGKSTLLNLLFRFYDPTSGSIEFDGVDLRSLRTDDLRRQMALVSQEIVLFDQSVADNIACGKLGASRDEIEAAARAAFADEFIREKPGGYDERVTERGANLSGGQRQRLCIARAFVRNAPLLILDEATASLDTQAEAEVQKSIDALSERRTVVCVAHRLSTLANMDRIIVLRQGRIVEDGGFKELLKRGGLFAAMARGQGIESA